MSEPKQTIERLEARLFELISTAQRNGLSPSMAISVGARPFLERLIELEKPHDPPPVGDVGDVRLCLVCAYEKPWGVFDSKTGATVCVECRDKARANAIPEQAELAALRKLLVSFDKLEFAKETSIEKTLAAADEMLAAYQAAKRYLPKETP